MYTTPSKANSQLVATCFFSKVNDNVSLVNYDKYYRNLDTIKKK